ncbi:helix-turn-helix domain-containing protein [Cohnella zeiphila]|uniref:Helix-turn-helix domain-containing protein n=1 Tax=Cohnella zeiphila TaxID=2761120 RepID=A0A7X0SS29_9BACL|nr:helix-turn-helix domain-containing protein [Cohnella zeiphila]MBB6734069.1 helix-turn-helix domain-containing protein [Cohnella zeiphila]
MKKTVVVVDDKPLILRSIVQTVDWNRLNCTVVGQAADGIEGKRVILDKQPDILITDIKMPGLSGLDLAECMHRTLPRSKTILITGYQEFEFAKQAVRLGVCDIVVKPVRNDELQRVIGLAVRELDDAQSELSQRLPSLRSQFVTELIGGSAPQEHALTEKASALGLIWNRCVVLIVRSKRTPAAVQGADSLSIYPKLHGDLTEMAQDAAERRDFEIVDSYRYDDLVLACLFPKPLPPRELKMKLQSFCHDFIERVRQKHGLMICIAVSPDYRRLQELREAYAEASALMDASFFRTEEPVLFPEPAEPVGENGRFSILRDLEQFNQMLEQATSDEIVGHLNQILEHIRAYSEGNILVAKGLLSDVCLATARYYYRVTGDEFSLDRSIDEVLADVYRLQDIRQAYEHLAAFIRNVKDKLEGGEKEYSLVVKKSIDYINGHFAENISLTGVADRFGLSPSYLSRLLRTETGINFVDLVAKARIEAAKRLLRDPRHKVNEVGEKVGYKEYSYFYQVFKKIEGMSPKEYKNRSKDSY